ncbi:hypothetical protein FBU30_005097 [Linnemannia zychae]|nr:hypothetical protein FBU30_005097 [Linnemannia zychae]
MGPNNTMSLWSTILNKWNGIIPACPNHPVTDELVLMPSIPSEQGENGELLLFGGLDESNTTTGQIYIYNIPTNTWRHGTPSSNTRARMVCATAGNYLVIWGGYTNGTEPVELLFYNIKNDAWVGSPSSSNTNLTDNSKADPKSNKAVVIGGIAGAVLVIGIIIGSIFICHFQQDVLSRYCSRNKGQNRGTNGDTSQLSTQDKLNLSLPHYTQLCPSIVDTCDKPFVRFTETYKHGNNIKTEIPVSVDQEHQEHLYLLPSHIHSPSSVIVAAPTTLVSPIPLTLQHLNPSRNNLQRSENDPQYIEPIPTYSSDHGDFQHDSTQVELLIRDPHGQHTRTPAVSVNFDSQKEAVKLQIWYEQALNNMRKRHQEDLARQQAELSKQGAAVIKMQEVLKDHISKRE